MTIEIPEVGSTFAENATQKAETVSRICGADVVADDSGLCVEALEGAPGIYSARYAGIHGDDDANNRLLLDHLVRIPAPRRARFVCVVALARPGRPTLLAEGICEGEIAFAPQGTGGFGYDPLFLTSEGRFSEIPESRKNIISHRAKALRNLLRTLDYR